MQGMPPAGPGTAPPSTDAPTVPRGQDVPGATRGVPHRVLHLNLINDVIVIAQRVARVEATLREQRRPGGATATAEDVGLQDVLRALSHVVKERSMSPEEDAQYYRFFVRLAAENDLNWNQKLSAVKGRYARVKSATALRKRTVLRRAWAQWDATTTGGPARLLRRRQSSPQRVHVSSPDQQRSQAAFSMNFSLGDSLHALDTSRSTAWGDSLEQTLDVYGQAGHFESSSYTRVSACFRAWASLVLQSRFETLEFSQALSKYGEAVDQWRLQLLERVLGAWQGYTLWQLAAAHHTECTKLCAIRQWRETVQAQLCFAKAGAHSRRSTLCWVSRCAKSKRVA